MPRLLAALLVIAAAAAAAAAPVPRRATAEVFLAQSPPGLALLDADGEEKVRLSEAGTNGALSPDGRWLACVEFDHAADRCNLVLRPRPGKAGEPVTVPLVWGQVGTTGCLPVWSADGRRLLIGEERTGREYVHRVYERATGKLTLLKLPQDCWVSDWSPDGKRFLATSRAGGSPRLVWINADGTGEPEFLTPKGEVVYGPRLSPDGRRVLYQGAPDPPKGRRGWVRLYVMDLATRKRTAVDEPGEIHGYCWSPDGSRVAYTWQRSLEKPAEVAERETLLITCNRDGTDRKTVTRRTYKPKQPGTGVVYFFWVLDWR
jgi:Tol biopolymer transport system component